MSLNSIGDGTGNTGKITIPPGRAAFVPLENEETEAARQTPRFEIDPETGTIKKRAVHLVTRGVG